MKFDVEDMMHEKARRYGNPPLEKTKDNRPMKTSTLLILMTVIGVTFGFAYSRGIDYFDDLCTKRGGRIVTVPLRFNNCIMPPVETLNIDNPGGPYAD